MGFQAFFRFELLAYYDQNLCIFGGVWNFQKTNLPQPVNVWMWMWIQRGLAGTPSSIRKYQLRSAGRLVVLWTANRVMDSAAQTGPQKKRREWQKIVFKECLCLFTKLTILARLINFFLKRGLIMWQIATFMWPDLAFRLMPSDDGILNWWKSTDNNKSEILFDVFLCLIYRFKKKYYKSIYSDIIKSLKIIVHQHSQYCYQDCC